MKVGAEAVSKGETSTQIIESLIRETIETSPLAKIDYVGVVDSSSFEIPNKIATEVRLLVACNFGQARLIDNLPAKKKLVVITETGRLLNMSQSPESLKRSIEDSVQRL